MKTKPGVRIDLDSLARGTPTTNAKGFNSRTLGSDTKPGREAGAPLFNERRSDDSTIKRAVFHAGHGDTSGLNGGRQHGHVLGPDVETDAPGKDTPVRGHGEQPNKRADSKAGEVASVDPRAGLAAHFTGTASR